ncbi:MAG: hypothetical protein DRJ32_06815, partial [Thermoprotei archaeon]
MERLIKEALSLGIDPETYLREVFQKLILYSYVINNLGSYYVFQGGTALRLFYNSPRFSLDMDFSLINRSLTKAMEDSTKVLNTLSHILAPYKVEVSKSREKALFEENFYRFFYTFNTLGIIRRKIRIKLEIAERNYMNVSFSRKILALEFPIHTSIGLIVKSPAQLLCDKVTSLAGGFHRGYIRWRDIFDIYWLKTKINARIDSNYLKQEFGSYIETKEDLEKLVSKLKALSGKELGEA